MINPNTSDRTYEEKSFIISKDDEYFYVNKLMDGVNNYVYQGNYYVEIIDNVYEEYYFRSGITTSNYLSLNDDEMCDYYSIDIDGNPKEDNNFSASSYLECYGALSIKPKMVKTTLPKYLAFYDENKVFLSSVSSNKSDVNDVEERIIDVPNNAYYFKTTFYNFEISKTLGYFEATIYYPDNMQLLEKRNNIDVPIYFSQKVNQNLDYYEDEFYIDNKDDYKQTTGVLLLPENYSATGEKTKLIIYCHGYSHYVYYDTWGSTINFLKQKEYFLERGYAVMGCNGARDNNKENHFTSAGSPQFVNAYHECLNYVLEHYNIDSDVYVIGGSAGGPLAINYAYTYMDEVKALQLTSTWTNTEVDEWGQGVRGSFKEYLNFANTSTFDHEKGDKYNPSSHIINNKITDLLIPISIFYGENEATSFFIDELINTYYEALKDGGMNVIMKKIVGFGHDIVSGNVEISDSHICDFFNQY